jgi:hypothetical protein
VEQSEIRTAQTRFLRAVHALAISTDPLQERVGAAWLELMALRRDDMPPALHEAFGAVEGEMLAAPDDLSTITDEAAIDAAERILRLAVELWGSG